jgi:hypothetical protein
MILPGQTVAMPHSKPIAISHTAAHVLPSAALMGPPEPVRTVHMVLQMHWPACTLDNDAEPGAAASAKNTLKRHLKVAMWIAPSADVVGVLGDSGAEKDSSVGWMSVRSGSRRIIERNCRPSW